MDPGGAKKESSYSTCIYVSARMCFVSCTTVTSASPYSVESCHRVSAVLALDDGFLVRAVPVLELSVELDGDDLQVARVVVPG